MSIIIGMICKDGLVVASDSQATWGTHKRTDSDKIYKVTFQNGAGLIANSGDVSASLRAVEITQSLCGPEQLTDSRQLAENAAKAVSQVRSILMEPYRSFANSPQSFDQLFRDHDLAILTANYYGGLPYIYTIEFPAAVPTKQKQHAAIGCGANLAEFLLSWFDTGQMLFIEGMVTALYIIEEVKKYDAYCGGPAQLGYISFEDNHVARMPAEVVSFLGDEMDLLDKSFKNQWQPSLASKISSISKRLKAGEFGKLNQ